MAGRSFRQTRPNVDRNQDGTIVTENPAEDATGIVHSESSGDFGEDRVTFTASNTGEESTVNTDDFPIDPNSITDSDNEPRRKRTRSDAGQKRGPRSQKRAAFSSQGNLEKLLLSLHMMGATFLKVPELRIDAEESAILSKATLDVFRAYGIPELTDKQLAAGNFAMALATVYGPRVIVVMSRKTSRPKLVPFPAAPPIPEQPMPPVTMQSPINVVGGAAQSPAGETVFVSSSLFAADNSGIETINAT